MTDPTPSEILAKMVSEAPDDAVGEWRVRVPTPYPPTFAEEVVQARYVLAGTRETEGPRRDVVALINLLTASLARHETGLCACRMTRTQMQVDPICGSAQAFAHEIVTPRP